MRMLLVPVCQPILGCGRIPAIDLMAGSGMMAGDVVTCLRVGMHGGGKDDGRGDRQNMLHFTLHSSFGEWSLRPRNAFESGGLKIGARVLVSYPSPAERVGRVAGHRPAGWGLSRQMKMLVRFANV
jgi:hypothetical protein